MGTNAAALFWFGFLQSCFPHYSRKTKKSRSETFYKVSVPHAIFQHLDGKANKQQKYRPVASVHAILVNLSVVVASVSW